MPDEKVVPGLILASKFVTAESKRFKKFIDYLDRDSATRNIAYPNYSAFMSDYMDNPKKQQDLLGFDPASDRVSSLFSVSGGYLTESQKEFYKNQFTLAQKNGSVMWENVISFRNDFLQEQGLYDSQTHVLNVDKMMELTRKAMRSMLHDEDMEQSAKWVAAIHYNTRHIHIHVAVVEPYPTREEIEFNDQKELRGKIKLSTLDDMKSQVVNGIVNRSEELNYINQIIREKMIQSPHRDALEKDFRLRKQFLDLYRSLPQDRRTWKYNMNAMKPYRPMIDALSKAFIERYCSADMRELTLALDKQEAILKKAYGTGNRALYQQYRKTKMEDLYTRFGNSILTQMRKMSTTGGRNAAMSHARSKRLGFARIRRRFSPYRELNAAIYSLRQALRKDIGHIKNQIAFDQMQRLIAQQEQEARNSQDYPAYDDGIEV